MNYILRGKNNYNDPLQTFLENRGVENIEQYKNLDDSVVIPYQNLTNIDKAVEIYQKHIEKNDSICVLIDPDVDGYTSAAMVYLYTQRINPECKLTYILHEAKGHGLTDEIAIPDDTKLLFIPDGGTNDTEQCKALSERGIDIIVLDHHEQEHDNPYACIVNNQCSDNYENKQLSGAGIVYKFLQACDEEMWFDEADSFLDLVALAQISDNMDMRSPETKYLALTGINAIVNRCFEALIEAQSFYFPDEITIFGIQFYITPIINALIRMGSQEEKDILFKAFIGDETGTYTYKKRGEKEPTEEDIYSHAARICTNAKARQKKLLDKQLPLVIENIENKQQNEKEIIVTNATDIIPTTLTGLVAMKIADKYNKPCFILQKRSATRYGGSARVPDDSPIDNLKNVINDMGYFTGQGHASAFGIDVQKDYIVKGTEVLNKYIIDANLIYKGTRVDFELDYEDLNLRVYRDITSLKSYYGTGLKEVKVAIKNIPVSVDSINYGKNNMWSILVCDEAIKIVQFGCADDDEMINLSDDCTINIIGTFDYSYYNGIKQAQIIVKKCEICS